MGRCYLLELPQGSNPKTWVQKTCLECGQVFYLQKYYANRGQGKFCCTSCGVSFRNRHNPVTFREKNSNWRGGKITRKGYVYILMPDHPQATKAGYVAEHRLVMEGILGRYLTKEETLHHKDGNTLNNSPDNLELYPSQSEHQKYHITSYPRNNNGRFTKEVVNK